MEGLAAAEDARAGGGAAGDARRGRASRGAAGRRRLGWLGPAIVGLGAAVAAVAVWTIATGRPEPGPVIDTIRLDDRAALIVRAEQGGDRHFVELREGDRLAWRALVPPYAGRPGAPGVAWNRTAVSVRVVRGGRAEVFALAMRDGSKLGGFTLAPGKGPAAIATRGPVTLTDHVRSYEIVSGDGWHQLVAFDLSTGEGLWKQDLGATPVDGGGLAGAGDTAEEIDRGVVWLQQGERRRTFRVTDGTEMTGK
jgi:hypothetical protein